MSSVQRNRLHHSAWALVVCGGTILSGAVLAGCATAPGEEEDLAFSSAEQDVTAAAVVGDALAGISATDFAAAKAAFNTVEGIDDGLGPIFNEKACGNCHTQGAAGGAGVQIERRFGKVVNGVFNSLANEGGSLRQLFANPPFTGLNGQSCTVPVGHEPADATVHNVG